MAIDTREKRASTVAVSLYPLGPSVTPNSDKDQEWRQQAGYGYSGILVSAITGSVTLTAPAISQTLSAPALSQSLEAPAMSQTLTVDSEPR